MEGKQADLIDGRVALKFGRQTFLTAVNYKTTSNFIMCVIAKACSVSVRLIK